MNNSVTVRLASVCLGVWAACFMVSDAHAQRRVDGANKGGMDTHLFRAALDSKGFFTVDGTDVMGANDFSFGLVMDYGRHLLRLEPNHDEPRLIDHSFQGAIGVNYGLFNVATIGMTAPVNLMAGGRVKQIGPSNSPYDSGDLDVQQFSYIALHSKLRLLRPSNGFGLALAVQAGLPVTKSVPESLGADPGFWAWPRVLVEGRIGKTQPFRIGASAGFRFHTGDNPTFDQLQDGKLRYGNLVTAGLGLSYRALEALDIVAETYSTYLPNSYSSNKQKLSAEAIGGFKVFVEPKSFLLIGAGRRYTAGFQGADLRLTLGFVYEPSIGDRDGDGIRDDVDRCPDVPENFNHYEDEDGCPDVVPTPKEKPLPPRKDRDGDGIPDDEDMCPDDGGDVIRERGPNYGCPDRDGDGIPDKEDQCPDEGGDVIRKRGPHYGCPDRDRDGIPDNVDQCPDEPETYNGFQDEDGCPDQGKVVVEDNEIMILEKIQFETNSAEIRPQSFELLDAITATLKHHTEFTLVEVGGHADERGTDIHNMRLTQARVTSVREALIQRGIKAERLKAVGYGEYCPLDPASNPAAWEKNRRVEFKILRTENGDTGVETGCEKARLRGIL